MRIFLITLALMTLTACKHDEEAVISFIALGDAPNSKKEYPLYESLIKKVNAAEPSLVVHVGDTHGRKFCSNIEIDRMRSYMNNFTAPVLYTPGDNDWTDCEHAKDGNFDSLERLNYLRQTHFNSGKTLGSNPLSVFDQKKAGYPENIRFIKNNIGFITVHVVGSKNNLKLSDVDKMQEFYARNLANLAWLEESFEMLNKADAIIVVMHANIFEKKFHSFRNIISEVNDNKKLLLRSKTYEKLIDRAFKTVGKVALPYRDIARALRYHSSELKKPVLLLHGDNHDHRIYQPFKNHHYFYAIEVYGSPDVKAIEIKVRPEFKLPFKVERVFSP